MRNTSLALCVLSAAGFAALALPAQAMPVAPAPLGVAVGESQVEQVAWRRVCRPVVVRWRHGRAVYSNRCTNVWVGNPRQPRHYGRAPAPRPPAHGHYGPPRSPRPYLF